MQLKAAIFDIDGTLLDTEGLQYLSWLEVLKPFGVSFTEEEYADYVGKSTTLVERELVNRYGIGLKEEGSLAKPKKELVMRWFEERPIPFMPYARKAMDYLRGRGVSLAAASNNSSAETTLKLFRKGILRYFSRISTRNDVERGKPYPDIYLHAASALGFEKEEMIAAEDTEYGVESAHSAGIFTCAIPNKYTVKQDFSKADMKFRDLKHLVGWAAEAYNL
ncbi:MAG: HAD family phosphatase [Candidatus Aenigmarchaeota archaeon]|nr:HAD family phosphatase [Candidatus Aenigmarchaeota archaeon]